MTRTTRLAPPAPAAPTALAAPPAHRASPARSRRRARTALPVVAGLALAALLASCAPAPAGSEADPTEETPHGYVEGAEEVSDPQPHLVTVTETGSVATLDLLSEERSDIGEVRPADAITTDGRFVFAAREGAVDIVDSGVWTFPHGDHVHYYRAPARVVGTVETEGGAGLPQIEASIGAVTVLFDGELVALDREALGQDEIVESARLPVEEDAVAAPIGDRILLGSAETVELLDRDGAVLDEIACETPLGSRSTRVGVVIGCADGAVLATGTGEDIALEAIPFPQGADPALRADAFASRNDRPSTAALAGGTGFWLLDTRARAWQLVATPRPLVRVSAVDDADEHVVAVDVDGRVVIADPTGVLAETEPLAAASLADPALADALTLTLDAERAYLGLPADGVVHEIDFRDGGRIARSFEMPAGATVAVETGR